MVGHGCACWGMDWHWLAQCGVPVRDRVWRVVAGYGGVSTFAAMPRHWRLDILLRAVKLRYGAGDPAICAQALSIGTGVDEEDCVAAGPRTMPGAAEFGVLVAKRGRRSTLKALPALRRRLYRRRAGSAQANPRLRTFGYRGEAQMKRPRRHRVLSVRHFQKAASRAAGLSWSQTRRVAQGL
jgi:hypothetical protein